MSYDKVSQASRISIGTKQTTKTVELGTAAEVLIARDAEPRITTKVVNLCKKKGVDVVYVDSMKQLGKACGIEVGAAMVAIVNE